MEHLNPQIQIAGRLLTLCLMILLSSCATTEPLTVVKPVTVILEKEVLIPVPESMTSPVEIPVLPENPDTIALGHAYKQTKIRLKVANMKLTEIANLQDR